MKYKMVIAVREDLKISSGKIAVQVAHAAVECALIAKRKKRKWFKEWYDEGQRKVVVKVKNVDEIMDLKKRAEKLKITTSLIRDAGLTEIPPGTITSLGIGPAPEEIINKVTGNLPLL